ncbi:MAG: DUF1772 domain-containing protein [Chloroflexota bacterium]|nr:DUF1772 domain-containing protein [Chloroflexota bacterium]
MSTLGDVSMVAATVATGLGAGVFYTFQVSILRALGEVDDAAYVTTFQSINRTIVNPWIVSVFLGAPVLAGAALALHWGADRPLVVAIAVGLALQVTSVAITVTGNIPLNEALDREGVVAGAAATAARTAFEASWNRLHLARTVASVGSFVTFGVASVLAARN